MTDKKKLKRGRKPLPEGQALKPITIFVREKSLGVARAACAAIAAKYR